MFKQWFDVSEALAFADSTAAEYCRMRARQQSGSSLAVRDPKRLTHLLDRVSTFSWEKRLNFYKRTRLLRRIQDRLQDEGVSAEDIEQFTRALLASYLKKRVPAR